MHRLACCQGPQPYFDTAWHETEMDTSLVVANMISSPSQFTITICDTALQLAPANTFVIQTKLRWSHCCCMKTISLMSRKFLDNQTKSHLLWLVLCPREFGFSGTQSVWPADGIYTLLLLIGPAWPFPVSCLTPLHPSFPDWSQKP